MHKYSQSSSLEHSQLDLHEGSVDGLSNGRLVGLIGIVA